MSEQKLRQDLASKDIVSALARIGRSPEGQALKKYLANYEKDLIERLIYARDERDCLRAQHAIVAVRDIANAIKEAEEMIKKLHQ